ncbi:hypothetical protein P7K49_036489, partial [Saguinus oedipus]
MIRQSLSAPELLIRSAAFFHPKSRYLGANNGNEGTLGKVCEGYCPLASGTIAKRIGGIGVGWGPFEAPVVFTALLTAISMVKNPPWAVTSGFIIGAFNWKTICRKDVY